jgi:hypothetical protein
MSMSNAFETNLLDLIFKNVNISLVGDATGLRGSSAAGSLFISLHTANPNEGGDQTTSEATYGGYARIAVQRSGAGWTVSGNNATNFAAVTFPTCTSGTNTVTHFGIGASSSGAGKLIVFGELTAPLLVETGVTPEFAAGELDTNAD